MERNGFKEFQYAAYGGITPAIFELCFCFLNNKNIPGEFQSNLFLYTTPRLFGLFFALYGNDKVRMPGVQKFISLGSGAAITVIPNIISRMKMGNHEKTIQNLYENIPSDITGTLVVIASVIAIIHASRNRRK